MTVSAPATRVGFIGLGIMGQSMAGHLLAAGFPLHLHNRSPDKAEGLIALGAAYHPTPAAVAANADVMITMLGYPADVEQVYFADNGLIPAASSGSYLIDMTTSQPALAVRIADAAKARGLHALDAPVTGGDVGAREARLSVMVGGAPEAFDAVLPLLRVVGDKIVLHGPPGFGQQAKLCNQIVVAGTMLGICEGLAYARESGLDAQKVLASLGSGAAASTLLSRLGPRIVAGDYAPGFYVRHFIKDLEIALADAHASGLELRALRVALDAYRRLASDGAEDQGTQALIEAYRKA